MTLVLISTAAMMVASPCRMVNAAGAADIHVWGIARETASGYTRRMGGLLERARQEAAGSPSSETENPPQTPLLPPEVAPQGSEADISPTERRDILAQIEEHVARSRTPLTPDRMAYQALRSGILFPIVINLAAVLLILAGLLLLPAVFKRREAAIAARERPVPSGEASLVGAVKQESEQRLANKDRQIEGIQARLDQAGQELGALRSGRDAEIARREQELRSALAAELEAQRQKLAKSGASASSMERELKTLEERKNAELARELEAFRSQKDAELAEREKAYDVLLAGLKQSLSQASTERAQLEAELLRSKTAAEKAAGDQARLASELAALRERSQREQLALDQLTAAYGQIASAMTAEHWPEALAKLESARALLGQPAVAELPAIQRRAAVDTFLLSSLRQLIDSRSGAAESKAASARQTLADALIQADAQYAAGNWRAAIDRYAEALALLKAESSALPASVARIADAGYRQGIADLSRQQDRIARTIIDKADALAKQGELDKAVTSYASVIESYPASSLVARALQGLESVLDARIQRTQAEIAARDRTIAGMQAAEKTRTETARKAAEATQGRLKVLTDGLGAAARRVATSAEAARQELISLLQAKVLVKEVLASETVKAEHPGLADSLERYVELYGEQKRGEGRAAALADVSAVADYLLGKKSQDDLAQVWTRSTDEAQRAAFQQVIDRLKLLGQ